MLNSSEVQELDSPALSQLAMAQMGTDSPGWCQASIPITHSGDGQSSARAWNHGQPGHWGGQGGSNASSTHPTEQMSNGADFCFSLPLHRLSFHLPSLRGRNYGINCLVAKRKQLQ